MLKVPTNVESSYDNYDKPKKAIFKNNLLDFDLNYSRFVKKIKKCLEKIPR
jgi:hypothetical protein